jgi:hypothetical protein
VLMILAALVGRKIAKVSAAAAAGESALVESKVPMRDAVPSVEWEPPRSLGKTPEGLDRYMFHHPNGEYVEMVVDTQKQTIRATRVLTGEVVTYENGQLSRGPVGLLPAATVEGANIIPTESAAGLKPSATPLPAQALAPGPAAAVGRPAFGPGLPATVAAVPLAGKALAPQAPLAASKSPPITLRPAGHITSSATTPIIETPAGGTAAAQSIRSPTTPSTLALPTGPQPIRLLTPGESRSATLVAPNARAIAGTPGVVTGGYSQTLGRNLMRSFGLPGSTSFSGWQPHHLIPTEATTHPVIEKIGMNLDIATNGIMLPEPRTGWPGTLPTHQGYHSLFSNIALDELDKMDLTLPVPSLELKVYGLQQRLRLAIEEGTPLYYSKGGTVLRWQLVLNQPVPR